MVSWQAHFADAIFRMTVKPRLARRKDLECVRAIMSRWALPDPRGVEFHKARLGNVPGEWVLSARTPTSAATLIYFHGGGYFTGSAKAHRPITAFFAKRGFDVFVPEYRLAPESPYPAAVDDAEAVWDALISSGRMEVAVAGDSAGGGLALALMIRLGAGSKPLPFAAALFSPWTDLCLTGESLHANARREALFYFHNVKTAAEWYLNGADPRAPEISPLYGDLSGLPPMLIEVGERELLRDDSIRFARRARAHGVEATVNLWPGVFHAWQMAYEFLPEGRQSLEQTAAFLHQTRTNENSISPATHASLCLSETFKKTMAADLTEA
jgi:monoterpene epsilon-lactone hydrolase